MWHICHILPINVHVDETKPFCYYTNCCTLTRTLKQFWCIRRHKLVDISFSVLCSALVCCKLLWRTHLHQNILPCKIYVTGFVQILEKSGKFWNLKYKFSRSWKKTWKWLYMWKSRENSLKTLDTDLKNANVCNTGCYPCICYFSCIS